MILGRAVQLVLPVSLLLGAFVLEASLSSPTTLKATASSSSAIQVSWIDNENQENGFEIERSFNSTSGFLKIVSVAANTISYQNTGLTSGTTYYYRVRAFRQTGGNTTYSSYSNVASATTLATIPNSPSNLSASAVSTSQINLSWTDNSSNETGFRIERSGSSSGPWSQITTTGVNTRSYSNTGLVGSTYYYYRVRAYNSAGNSSYSNVASVRTLTASSTPTPTPTPSDKTAPSVPTGLTTSAASCSQINLSWNASSDSGGSGLKAYKVYRSASFLKQVTTTSTSDTGLSGSTIYAYTVSAVDNAGNESAKSAAASTNTPSCTSSSGQYLWSRDFGGSTTSDSAWANGVATDTSGNAVAVGQFLGTVNFGGGNVTTSGSYDIFVVKYSASGSHVWSKRLGGSGSDNANAVTVDRNGNVVVAGSFYSPSVDFGGGALTNAGYYDAFVAKYSPSGGYLWVKRLGGANTDIATAVAVDTNGNVVVAGYFQGTVDFGGGALTSAGGSDIFVAKYSSTGSYLWAKRFGGTSSDIPKAVAVDGSGNVAVMGYFQGTVNFGGGTLTSAGSSDIFVAKYSATGSYLWSKRFGGTSSDYGYAVAVDGSGNVVVAGDFVGTVDFGGGAKTASGGGNIFLAKYSATGGYLWAKNFGTSSSLAPHASGVAVDGNGNIALTGAITDYVDFGGGQLMASQITGDIFVAKFSAGGTHVWSKRAGGDYNDHGNAIAFDGSGNVFDAGDFYTQANFGGATMYSPGGTDAYLVKFAP